MIGFELPKDAESMASGCCGVLVSCIAGVQCGIIGADNFKAYPVAHG